MEEEISCYNWLNCKNTGLINNPYIEMKPKEKRKEYKRKKCEIKVNKPYKAQKQKEGEDYAGKRNYIRHIDEYREKCRRRYHEKKALMTKEELDKVRERNRMRYHEKKAQDNIN
jgi:hypothetical protein